MPVAASFRDPGGFCVALEQRILRVVTPVGIADFESFFASAAAREFLESRQVVATRRLAEKEVQAVHQLSDYAAGIPGSVFFEHEKISFPSFPYEWAPEMLVAAGELTLHLARRILEEGFGLKDATPYNLLFRGTQPVFVDLLSFERRAVGDAIWKPYAQFVRTFLLPLLINQRWGMPLSDIFLSHRDGLEPEWVYKMCGPLQRILPPYLTLVSLPVWLSRKGEKTSVYKSSTMADSEKAQFIVQSLLGRLQRTLNIFKPKEKSDSAWSGYMESHSYSKENFTAKEQFIRRFLEDSRPKRVLDVGANTGHFSFLAAQAGAEVVAIDSDPVCVGNLWRQSAAKHLNILPLVLDFARPTPSTGWRNRESPSFLERATGAFDAVLMLAVLHHLMVTERVPLDEIFSLASQLTKKWLLLEYVGPGDPMFQKIARGRDNLFTGLDPIAFEQASAKYFDNRCTLHLPGMHRSLYLLQKKN